MKTKEYELLNKKMESSDNDMLFSKILYYSGLVPQVFLVFTGYHFLVDYLKLLPRFLPIFQSELIILVSILILAVLEYSRRNFLFQSFIKFYKKYSESKKKVFSFFLIPFILFVVGSYIEISGTASLFESPSEKQEKTGKEINQRIKEIDSLFSIDKIKIDNSIAELENKIKIKEEKIEEYNTNRNEKGYLNSQALKDINSEKDEIKVIRGDIEQKRNELKTLKLDIDLRKKNTKDEITNISNLTNNKDYENLFYIIVIFIFIEIYLTVTIGYHAKTLFEIWRKHKEQIENNPAYRKSKMHLEMLNILYAGGTLDKDSPITITRFKEAVIQAEIAETKNEIIEFIAICESKKIIGKDTGTKNPINRKERKTSKTNAQPNIEKRKVTKNKLLMTFEDAKKIFEID